MAYLKERAILHVIVVGFHHKKGCQVEFAYPPLVEENEDATSNVPDLWKHLPSLALPDGAHNYTSDTVYFHLPSKTDPMSTVYGISCYRQMDASKLLKKDSEVTRNTIQKSVCVLSTLPLYGLIQAKLELITHVYFKECDFSKVSILEDAYTQLNAQLNHSMLGTSNVFLGLSCRSVVNRYKSKILILIKLLMLERRVLFYGGPAKDVCTTLLSILSLFPELVEHGLKESAAYSPSKQLSPTLKNIRLNSMSEDFLEVQYSSNFLEQCHAKAPEVSSAEKVVYKKEGEGGNIDIPDLLANVKTHSDHHHHLEGDDSKPQEKGDIAVVTAIPVPVPPVAVTPDEEDNMDQLLDTTDDVCDFQADRLSLQITTTSSVDSSPCHGMTPTNAHAQTLMNAAPPTENEKERLLVENKKEDEENEKTLGEGENAEDKENIAKVHHLSRSDSHQSNTSQGSLSSVASDLSQASVKVASDLGQASVKAMTGIKTKITSMWPGGVVKENQEEGQQQQQHQQKTEENKKATPTKMRPQRTPSPTTLVSDALGFPLPLFTKGVLCHPYLSLQYYDLMRDANVRGFAIGASNMLFKQKRNLLDVIVEPTEDGDIRIDIADAELRKQLNLTTADLRFTETLMRSVTDNSGDGSLMDETEWEGGDEWLREQFRVYLVALLATVNKNDAEHMADFNLSFIQAWQTTLNYRIWKSVDHPGLDTFAAGHPYQGNLGMDDVRLKVAHSLNSTERGKKVAAAAAHTGKAVLTTGKAVGGALSTAKTAMSSSVTSLFGRIRHWTQTEGEEEPYMPAANTNNQSNNTTTTWAGPKFESGQSGASSQMTSKTTGQSGASSQMTSKTSDQLGASSQRKTVTDTKQTDSSSSSQQHVEAEKSGGNVDSEKCDPLSGFDAGDGEGEGFIETIEGAEVKVHEPVALDMHKDS